MTIAWVVGGGGLLGSAIIRALQRKETTIFIPSQRFNWRSEMILDAQLKDTVKAFSSSLAKGNEWLICWAAGIGTMNCSEEDLAFETKVLSLLLNYLKADPTFMESKGRLVLASTAGAIYAGAAVGYIDENTQIAPTTKYACEKLRQEEILSEFVFSNKRASLLIARIATLYGPGQAKGKQQGLISLIASRILRNQPIQIFVPFDTIRDYLFVDDAANLIVNTIFRMCGESGALTKIIASEQPTTIAEIISIYRKISKYKVRIYSSTNTSSYLYSRQLQFRSILLTDRDLTPRTSLFVGIAKVMAAERLAFAQPCKLSTHSCEKIKN